MFVAASMMIGLSFSFVQAAISHIRWLIKSNIYTNTTSYHASNPAIERIINPGFGILPSLLIRFTNLHTSSSMSSVLNITSMASSKKEKHSANRSARRHSGEVIISHSKKSKKDKDTDIESVSSSTPSSIDIAVNPELKKCPLRFVLAGLFETGGETDEKKAGDCPLRRVQLWHTIPLCLLAAINLLLVVVALLGLAGYRIAMGIQGFLVNLARSDLDCNPYLDSLQDEAGPVEAEKVK
jgi:hypothetical protein